MESFPLISWRNNRLPTHKFYINIGINQPPADFSDRLLVWGIRALKVAPSFQGIGVQSAYCRCANRRATDT